MAPAKKRYRVARDKYSVEQTSFNGSVAVGQTTSFVIVPPTTLQGMRKVKHLTINAVLSSSSSIGCVWALYYLPQGMTAPGLNLTSGQPLVEPNQFVMNTGVFDGEAGPTRISSRLSRNLNSGDQIILLVTPVTTSSSGNVPFTGVVRYAVTLQ